MTLYVGVDIGGTKIAAALVTEGGLVVARRQCPTQAELGAAHVVDAATGLAADVLGEAGEAIAAVGIGAGGQIDAERGVVRSATDLLPGWGGTNVKRAFEDRLGLPTFVDNDVNALAVGEYRFGCARGLSTVVFLALGTGVGGALLFGGRLHRGANWCGGEFGHLIVDLRDDARVDAGGGRGTLEAYASGPGIVQTWREIAGDYETEMTAYDVAADADVDPGGVGALAIARTGASLGCGLASLANALDPDAIVIGGGLAELGERLLAPARRVLAERGLPGPGQCPVRVATLGAEASVVGAASLAMV